MPYSEAFLNYLLILKLSYFLPYLIRNNPKQSNLDLLLGLDSNSLSSSTSRTHVLSSNFQSEVVS